MCVFYLIFFFFWHSANDDEAARGGRKKGVAGVLEQLATVSLMRPSGALWRMTFAFFCCQLLLQVTKIQNKKRDKNVLRYFLLIFSFFFYYYYFVPFYFLHDFFFGGVAGDFVYAAKECLWGI